MNNYFTFNDCTYHNSKAPAMGSPCSCRLREHLHVSNGTSTIFLLSSPPLSYSKEITIDDLFAVTVEDRIKEITDEPILTNCPVKFTYETSKVEIIMLDLKLSILDNAIKSKINFKQTNKFQYISAKIFHPPPYLEGGGTLEK